MSGKRKYGDFVRITAADIRRLDAEDKAERDRELTVQEVAAYSAEVRRRKAR